MLIIDDAQTDRELLGRVVTSTGHRPIYAADGAAGVASAKEHQPALIFLDVVMPTQDGFATCRVLKRDPATSAIPVVLVTSKNTDSDKFWGKQAGRRRPPGQALHPRRSRVGAAPVPPLMSSQRPEPRRTSRRASATAGAGLCVFDLAAGRFALDVRAGR